MGIRSQMWAWRDAARMAGGHTVYVITAFNKRKLNSFTKSTLEVLRCATLLALQREQRSCGPHARREECCV